ncbi:ATP-binding protein (plasmid) [Leuconostoc lactis]|uniref:AAA family ATPase n=1 Tax=Leuconostoc lactis TaxID=1246 RepID=UPI0011BBC8BC|nr:AAA family ATPase [Leuconostoc lactis]QEA48313.1 ATP-binding protein [Leuconostoc lactis]QEA48346.1 ATP-binding protein [Leuconostoc lactis]
MVRLNGLPIKKHCPQIGTVLNNNDIKFNNNHDNIDLVKVIMKKLTHFTFDLLLGNDSLQEMSPGMKGVVLLQVLLMASNNQSTIILDQPEDDLDNNTIVKMLVPLLKEISNTRQVILVTHNANLVVLTDAEE